MNPIQVIVRATAYKKDEKYFLRLHRTNGDRPEYLPVKFICYDPCPGLVRVSDCNGRLWRIPREDVYTHKMCIES